jgi:tetratricopeptide (TPR) repeat protein
MTRNPVALAILAMSAVLLAAPALAQSQKDEPRQLPPGTGQLGKEPRSDPKADPKAPKPVLPQARSDGARSLERAPQTAEEKSKALADLYAQLAAADSEETAKKHASAIERLWRVSGSDTVTLLISRATKAISDKRHTLAEKLLDRAVALAPDYPEAFNQRAYMHFTQNNYHAAVGDLRRVLALDPNHYKAMEGLAQIWRETGNKKGAYEVMRQLLDVHPFAPGARKVYEELKREVEGQGI